MLLFRNSNAGLSYQRDYMVEINQADIHEEIKSSGCRKIKFQKCFKLSKNPLLQPKLFGEIVLTE